MTDDDKREARMDRAAKALRSSRAEIEAHTVNDGPVQYRRSRHAEITANFTVLLSEIIELKERLNAVEAKATKTRAHQLETVTGTGEYALLLERCLELVATSAERSLTPSEILSVEAAASDFLLRERATRQ